MQHEPGVQVEVQLDGHQDDADAELQEDGDPTDQRLLEQQVHEVERQTCRRDQTINTVSARS